MRPTAAIMGIGSRRRPAWPGVGWVDFTLALALAALHFTTLSQSILCIVKLVLVPFSSFTRGIDSNLKTPGLRSACSSCARVRVLVECSSALLDAQVLSQMLSALVVGSSVLFEYSSNSETLSSMRVGNSSTVHVRYLDLSSHPDRRLRSIDQRLELVSLSLIPARTGTQFPASNPPTLQPPVMSDRRIDDRGWSP